MNTHLQTAHQFGVAKALEKCGYDSVTSVEKDAMALGLIEKTAMDPGTGSLLLGPLGAALAAPEGLGFNAAGGSMLGSSLGTAAGGIGGAGLGALLGALAHNPGLGAEIGGLGGAGLGAMAGGYMGANKAAKPPGVMDALKEKLK